MVDVVTWVFIHVSGHRWVSMG